MIESLIYSRWPFNDRIETAPRRANEAGSYSVSGLANALSLAEVATVVRDWTTAGRLLPVTIETGGEPSISTYRSHRVAAQKLTQFSLMWRKVDGSLIPLNQKDQYLPTVAGQPRQLNPHWYTGPTQCPHRAVGCPCYGPYPHEIKMPSFMTPKREGQGSKRADPNKSGQGGQEGQEGQEGLNPEGAFLWSRNPPTHQIVINP